MRWLDSITDSMDMNLSKPQKTVKDKEAWHVAVHGVKELNKTEQQEMFHLGMEGGERSPLLLRR